MQQSVVQPINSQRGMAARGSRGQSEFWTRRNSGKFTGYHCTAANKALSHRHERRVAQKQEIRFWEEDERIAFEADMKEMNDFFDDMEADEYDPDYDDLYFATFKYGDLDSDYFTREQLKAQLEDEFNYHNEPYYSGCPICGPLGCILD